MRHHIHCLKDLLSCPQAVQVVRRDLQYCLKQHKGRSSTFYIVYRNDLSAIPVEYFYGQIFEHFALKHDTTT